MENFTLFQQKIYNTLIQNNIQYADIISISAVLIIIVISSALFHYILHRFVNNKLKNLTTRTQKKWHKAFFERNLFNRAALTLQGFILHLQAELWLNNDGILQNSIHLGTRIWILVLGLLTFYSILDIFLDNSKQSRFYKNFPIRGLFQTIKLISTILVGLMIVSILIGKSPLILLSGLGAMTAVFMLVFKDPIMGLVAGIQLSANNMLSVGDWLEMPKYGADGDVIDINLTTVKVQNWDKTITTIPTYALISDSFKNWRGMQESGGRRIKRSIFIDTQTIRFLNEADLKKLNKANLLYDYINNKTQEINEYNSKSNLDLSSLVNGRRLTNIGTFRAYIDQYLKNHQKINKEMIIMVRQLSSSNLGVPLEIYCFTNTTAWIDYENIQSDIFDHILAVLEEFDLKIHQSPTGNDFNKINSL